MNLPPLSLFLALFLPPSLPGSSHCSLLMKEAAMLGAPCGRPREEVEAFHPAAHEELRPACSHTPERKADRSSPSGASRWDGGPVPHLTSSSATARSWPVEAGRWYMLFWATKFGVICFKIENKYSPLITRQSDIWRSTWDQYSPRGFSESDRTEGLSPSLPLRPLLGIFIHEQLNPQRRCPWIEISRRSRQYKSYKSQAKLVLKAPLCNVPILPLGNWGTETFSEPPWHLGRAGTQPSVLLHPSVCLYNFILTSLAI